MVSDLHENQTLLCRLKQQPWNQISLTKIEFPAFRFTRQQARKAIHFIAADLVVINVIVVTVTERPQVVRLVFSLDLTKSMSGR